MNATGTNHFPAVYSAWFGKPVQRFSAHKFPSEEGFLTRWQRSKQPET